MFFHLKMSTIAEHNLYDLNEVMDEKPKGKCSISMMYYIYRYNSTKIITIISFNETFH